MNDIVVRAWTAADVSHVRRIALETWKATYAAFIPEADMEAYLDDAYAAPALVRRVEDHATIGFIAECSGEAVGYMIVSVKTDEKRCYLSSLYVLPEFQGKGIGMRMVGEAERKARAEGFDRVWLGVMEKNAAALQWYRKLGFHFVEKVPFTMGGTTVQHFIGYKYLPDGAGG
jgi:ribosomal protein S18 acetylase RimI-like enzyme